MSMMRKKGIGAKLMGLNPYLSFLPCLILVTFCVEGHFNKAFAQSPSVVNASESLELNPNIKNQIKQNIKGTSQVNKKKQSYSVEQSFIYFTSTGRAAFRDVSLAKAEHSLTTMNIKRKTYGVWSSNIDLSATYSGQEQFLYVNAPELSMAYQINNENSFYVGRHLHSWAQFDEDWGLSFWQPRYEWSRLEPVQQGIMGIHWDAKWNSHLKSYAFYSPLFIPNLGPHFNVTNGRFIAQNPWFSTPAPYLTIPGLVSNKEIYYDLKIPPITDILFQENWAVQFSWILTPSQDLQLSYGHKPFNEPIQEFDAFVASDIPDSPPSIVIYPKMIYHKIANIQYSMKFNKKWSWVSSLGYDEAEDNRSLDNTRYTYQQWAQSHIVASGLQYKQGATSDFYDKYFLGILSIDGADKSDIGFGASESESRFERRLRFQKAIQAKYESNRWVLFGKNISGKLSGIYDFWQRGAILSTGLTIHLKRNLTILGNVSVLGLVDNQKAIVPDGFIAKYKANDQMSLGVQYVF